MAGKRVCVRVTRYRGMGTDIIYKRMSDSEIQREFRVSKADLKRLKNGKHIDVFSRLEMGLYDQGVTLAEVRDGLCKR